MTACNISIPAWEFILLLLGGIIAGVVISVVLAVKFKLWGILGSLAILAAGGFYLQWYITAHGC